MPITDNSFQGTFRVLVRAMCCQPDQLHMHYEPGRAGTFVVETSPFDYGAVCGKGGRNIRALKVIADAMAHKNWVFGADVILKELTERVTVHHKFQPNPQWDSSEFDEVATLTAKDLFEGPVRTKYIALAGGDYKMEMLFQTAQRRQQPQLEDALRSVFSTIAGLQGVRLKFELLKYEEPEPETEVHD